MICRRLTIQGMIWYYLTSCHCTLFVLCKWLTTKILVCFCFSLLAPLNQTDSDASAYKPSPGKSFAMMCGGLFLLCFYFIFLIQSPPRHCPLLQFPPVFIYRLDQHSCGLGVNRGREESIINGTGNLITKRYIKVMQAVNHHHHCHHCGHWDFSRNQHRSSSSLSMAASAKGCRLRSRRIKHTLHLHTICNQ